MKKNLFYFIAGISLFIVLWILFVRNQAYIPKFESFTLPQLPPQKLQKQLQKGEQLFVNGGCIKCHSFDTHRKAMTSSLDHLKKSANPGFAKAWMENPQKMRPGVKMPRSKASNPEILSLLYYLYNSPDTK